MQTINLYGEDGIAIGLTAEHDICNLSDDDAALRVIGHRLYACSADDAAAKIRDAYLTGLDA